MDVNASSGALGKVFSSGGTRLRDSACEGIDTVEELEKGKGRKKKERKKDSEGRRGGEGGKT